MPSLSPLGCNEVGEATIWGLGPGALLCSSQVICAQPGCQVSSVMIFFSSSARYIGAVRAGWYSLPVKTGLAAGLCCSIWCIWKLYLGGDTCGC